MPCRATLESTGRGFWPTVWLAACCISACSSRTGRAVPSGGGLRVQALPAGEGQMEPTAVPMYAESAPKVVYLHYPGTGSDPPTPGACGGATPPAFTCAFGTSIEDCKMKVQAKLDSWYFEFNVIFTFTKPTSGKYYSVVITNSGAWCGMKSDVLGIAPFTGGDTGEGTAYVFKCDAAQPCAAIAARGHGNMAGLCNTSNTKDVMFGPGVCTSCVGFATGGSLCAGGGGGGDSYLIMKTRMGTWPGGPKPNPFDGADGGSGADGGGAEVSAGGEPSGGDAGPPPGDAAGGSDGPSGGGCAPQCRDGFVCIAGTCESACNPDCPAGQRCTGAGQCVPEGADGGGGAGKGSSGCALPRRDASSAGPIVIAAVGLLAVRRRRPR